MSSGRRCDPDVLEPLHSLDRRVGRVRGGVHRPDRGPVDTVGPDPAVGQLGQHADLRRTAGASPGQDEGVRPSGGSVPPEPRGAAAGGRLGGAQGSRFGLRPERPVKVVPRLRRTRGCLHPATSPGFPAWPIAAHPPSDGHHREHRQGQHEHAEDDPESHVGRESGTKQSHHRRLEPARNSECHSGPASLSHVHSAVGRDPDPWCRPSFWE